MNKNFASNFLSQGNIEQDCLSKNVKKNQFLSCLIEISISVLKFNTESSKKPTLYDMLFLTAIYSPKNDNKHSSEMRNQYHSSHFTITEGFSGLGRILTIGLNIDLPSSFFL